MNIFGESVILRAIEPSDGALLLELINDPDTENCLGGSSFPVSELAQAKWIGDQTGNRNVLRCIVARKENPREGLGTIILSDIDYKNGVAQIHIKLTANGGRRQGYGTDAVKALTRYAFEQLRLHCIYAHILSDNIPSQKLFKKCNYKKEGVLRCRVYKEGQYKDMVSYSCVRDHD